MARKKSSETEVVTPEIEYTEEIPQTETEEETPINEPDTTPVEEIPVISIDYDKEMAEAQAQIQHCLDYIDIPGADYAGYYRGKCKEWRMYKYKLWQYRIRGGNLPTRPTDVEMKY